VCKFLEHGVNYFFLILSDTFYRKLTVIQYFPLTEFAFLYRVDRRRCCKPLRQLNQMFLYLVTAGLERFNIRD